MKVRAYKCPLCSDIIFSRTEMDQRWCSCGECWVARGPTNPMVGGVRVFPEGMDIKIKATEQELLADWKERKNEYGKI